MKGDKRKALFATVNVVESAPKKAKISDSQEEESAASAAAAPAAEATAAAPAAEATAAAPAAEDLEEEEKPDNQCMAMFGDLGLYT